MRRGAWPLARSCPTHPAWLLVSSARRYTWPRRKPFHPARASSWLLHHPERARAWIRRRMQLQSVDTHLSRGVMRALLVLLASTALGCDSDSDREPADAGSDASTQPERDAGDKEADRFSFFV